jgi:cardiolipin synthase
MTVRIAVPIQYSSVRVHVDKGRQWSVVEHLLLFALKERSRTATELAESSDLPPRMVVEALIYLMRAGWVEIVVKGDRTEFAITAGGLANVDLPLLPVITELVSRPMKFAIEMVHGSVLRWREIDFLSPARFARLKGAGILALPEPAHVPVHRQADVIASLLDDDERFRGLDGSVARPGRGYALVTVIGSRIDGLPSSAAPALQHKVLEIAGKQSPSSTVSSPRPVRQTEAALPVRRIAFAASDLILGGEDHLSHLHDVIRKARSSIVIHSTFVSLKAMETLLPLFREAIATRGVQIDILWGHSAADGAENSTGATIEECRKRIAELGLERSLRLHSFTTRSHAKLLIADDGRGHFHATVGSCNWLSTQFKAFEASARLTDPVIVSDVLRCLSEMAWNATGRWAGIVSDLAGRAHNLERQAVPGGGRKLDARIVLGPQHATLFETARDNAKARIVMGSHRLGAAAETVALKPTRAAIAATEVDALVLYGRPSGPIDGGKAASITLDGHASGLKVRRVYDPRMHAKFLLWDDNDLVITSQNLLSADPVSPWAEVGIYLQGAAVAREFNGRIEAALKY